MRSGFIHRITFTLLASLFLTACGSAPADSEEKKPSGDVVENTRINENWAVLSKEDYQIEYPKNWLLDTSRQNGTSFVIVSQRIDSMDNFSENINLVKQVVGTAGLKEYTDLSVQQVKDFMGQAKITGQDSFVRHNTRFYQVNFEAEQQGYRLVFEQHYAISKGVAYILTFSSEVDSYEMMKPMAARIMNSFSLK